MFFVDSQISISYFQNPSVIISNTRISLDEFRMDSLTTTAFIRRVDGVVANQSFDH